MLPKIVILLTVTVLCVNTECDKGCKYRQYTRVKRGKFYSSPPQRFYNRPPMTFPIKGAFSYTPPPFMVDDEPSYPGSRPFKVSKRPPVPSNDGLGDDDITNIVKHLSKQDLDKLLEFAQEKDQSNDRYNNYDSDDYNRPFKRESKITYSSNNKRPNYEEPPMYKENSNVVNYVTEPTYVKYYGQGDERSNRMNSQEKQRTTSEFDNFSPNHRMPDANDYASPNHNYASYETADFPIKNEEKKPIYVKVFETNEPPRNYAQGPSKIQFSQLEQIFGNTSPIFNQEPTYSGPNNPAYTETNEEEKLPPPTNMREEDFEASYTNKVQNIVKSDSSSYEVESFGDLPLMDYSSKLHDVSSYLVPHYTVTQPKPGRPSYSSTYSSSTGLKPSPAAAAIKEPVYERAPPPSVAAEQSDAHLKAIKIWSHKSQGAAYTLHDDGSLTPERSRPKYG